MAQQFWHIRNCSLFQRLTAGQLQLLERRARVRQFAKGSAVYLPTDPSSGAFLLAEGRIRIGNSTADGKQIILALVEPGELFGELALVQDGTREERAEAAMNSVVVVLPADELLQLMEATPALAIGVTRLIGIRRRRIERRLKSLLFRSNRDRLAHLLMELAESYGRRIEDGVLLDIRLSHQDLSSIIGATRESVTTVLGEMKEQRLLLISRQRIVIRDLQRLAAEVGAQVPEISTDSKSRRAALQFLRESEPIIPIIPIIPIVPVVPVVTSVTATVPES